VRGKVGSGKARWTVELRPLPKVVARLRRRYSGLGSRCSSSNRGSEWTSCGGARSRRRAAPGAQAVFANRLEDVGREHRGFLLDVATGRTDRGDDARGRGAPAGALVRARSGRSSEERRMNAARTDSGRILLVVTGGIAAYKACDVVRELRHAGLDVQVILTKEAGAFVTATTFEALSGRGPQRAPPGRHRRRDRPHPARPCRRRRGVVPRRRTSSPKLHAGLCDDLASGDAARAAEAGPDPGRARR
jgi:hypothetical protein